MKAKDLREWVASLTQGIELEFQNKNYYIDPFNATHFDLMGDGKILKCTSVDMVMSAPFFDRRGLNDIAEQIKIL